MYNSATPVLTSNSSTLKAAAGYAAPSQKPGTSRPNPWQQACTRVCDMLASIPPALGKMLMWVAGRIDGSATAEKEDNATSKSKIRRIEDADPWVAPPIFWC